MKNKVSYILIFLSLLFAFSGFVNFSKKAYAKESFEITSKSAYLIDAKSGKVAYQKDELKRLPIASMCKIMTLLICFEKIDNGELFYDESIIISDNAASMGGSQVFLEKDGEYLVDDLLKSIVVSSANDACVALSERIAGDEESFTELMNQKCKQLNMNDTRFVNCTGLPEDGQYSCAKDVAKMFSELIKHEGYFKYSSIWMDEIHHPKDRVTQISNTNKLIKFYDGCIGGKTGYTDQAGHCLTAVAKREDTCLISVVICSPDSKTRFKESSSLFNYGFSNFQTKKLIDKNEPLNYTIDVRGAKNKNINLYAKNDVYFFKNKSENQAFEFIFEKYNNLKAPIKSQTPIGKLHVFNKGICIESVDVVSGEDVNEKSFFDNICQITNNWSLI